jgi:hypothetical protein
MTTLVQPWKNSLRDEGLMLNRLSYLLAFGMKIVSIVAAVCLWPPAAKSDILLASSNRNGQIFSGPGGTKTFLLELNNSGAKTLNFTTSRANQQVVITFSASCELSPAGDASVGVQILVNPAGPGGEFVAPPTNNGLGSIVCGGLTREGIITGTTVVALAKPDRAGAHTVRVRLIFSSLGSEAEAAIFALSLSVLS